MNQVKVHFTSMGEAATKEEAVSRLRAHLRQAEALAQSGNWAAAQQASKQADAIIEELLKSLASLFDKYKWDNFRGQPLETQEDAVREMVLRVCQGLRNLAPKAGAQFFEKNFFVAVQSCIYDAIRTVWREQNWEPCEDKDDHDKAETENTHDKDDLTTIEQDDADSTNTKKKTKKRQILSLDEQFVSISGEPGLQGITEQLPDTEQVAVTDEALQNVIDDQLMDILRQQLPSQAHLSVLNYRLSGLPWDEIARKVGISEKTARNYYKTAQVILKQPLDAVLNDRKSEDNDGNQS